MSSKKHNRTQIDLDPSIVAALAAKPGRPQSQATTADRPKATYDLHIETTQAIRDIAAELQVPVYAVAQKLLDHALKEYREGRLELRRQPVTTQWRLK